MRGRMRRTGGKLFLIVGLVLAMLAGLEFAVTGVSGAAPVAPNDTATFVGRGPGLTIGGHFIPNDPKPHQAGFGDFVGVYRVRLNGATEIVTYCIDILGPDPTGSSTWHSGGTLLSFLQNYFASSSLPASAASDAAARILRIIEANPASASLSNTDAAGIQSAIWFFTNGFVPDDAAVLAKYTAVIADANAHPISASQEPSVHFSPATASGAAGSELGPLTMQAVNVGTVHLTVTPSGAAEIRNCTTHQPITTAVDGTKVCLFRATAGGPVTLTARAAAEFGGQQVLLTTRNPPDQSLLIVQPRTTAATATARWVETPTTTTSSTVASTTTSTTSSSTTTSSTTSTTVAPLTTSTTGVPVTVLGTQQTPPQANLPAQVTPPADTAPVTLPATGTQPIPTAILALTFLVLGALLLGLGRPMPAFAGFPGFGPRPRATWNSDIRPKLPWWLRRSHARMPISKG
ncbi:MAG: hypothetical protein QOG64_368 [Acidimicrobiaceae bacterium]|nr:hypothetical protein [Acidimicrobiaceae bacterium]